MEAIELNDNWRECDTSTLDELAPAWFKRREVLQEKSAEYREFMAELKREHAIETGIVERLYDLDKGLTVVFIKKGFAESCISHNDTNVPVPRLMAHLSDHLNAVDFVFDVVKENRPLTIDFINELHALACNPKSGIYRRPGSIWKENQDPSKKRRFQGCRK